VFIGGGLLWEKSAAPPFERINLKHDEASTKAPARDIRVGRNGREKAQPKELNHGFHGFHGFETFSDLLAFIRAIRAIRGKKSSPLRVNLTYCGAKEERNWNFRSGFVPFAPFRGYPFCSAFKTSSSGLPARRPVRRPVLRRPCEGGSFNEGGSPQSEGGNVCKN
jgi:hypothetical protein